MSTTYTLAASGGVVRSDDGANILADPANTDWQAFQAWLAAGNTPTPAPVVSSIPQQVPMWAMQAALQQSGRYSEINQTVSGWATSSDPGQIAAYFAWTMGNYASRASAFIATFAAQFGFASGDIDSLFTAANKIAVASG